MSPEEYDAMLTACRPFKKQILDLLDDGSVLVALGKFAIHALIDDRNRTHSRFQSFWNSKAKLTWFIVYIIMPISCIGH